MILPSNELVMDLERSEKDYMIDRMTAIQERDGNPEQVELSRFGNAVCLYSKTMPWPAFNTVKGFSNEIRNDLDQMVQFYESRNRKAQFEIVPNRVDLSLMREFTNRGFVPSNSHVSLYCKPEDIDLAVPEHVQLRELFENEIETYAKIHCRGTGLNDNGIPHVAANNAVLFNRQGWKFYIAFASDQPAAVAVMYIKNEIASLTFAAVLPQFRKQGLHQILLKRRILEAYRQGCKLVVGQCAFLSASHRNMERVGMKIGYFKTNWTNGV